MSPNITPEEIELIKSAQAGSELAFNRIFARYKGFVEHLMYQYLKDWDESRDMANIVFLRVHEKLSKFTAYKSFGGWLRILTRNVAIDYLRTLKGNHVSIDEEGSKVQLSSKVDAEVAQVNKMTYDYLIKLLDKLPPLYRDVCRLFYEENMTVAQISKALKIPEGTIKSDLFRMRKLFKKHLNIKEA